MSAEFSSTIETITPEIAERYLARNIKNRNRKPQRIAMYACDMAAGKWPLTGEAIKFDTHGNLIDGQNRLYACIEADTAFRTVVQRGLAPETQGIMDNSAPRSGADQLVMNGFANGKNLQALCNAHRAYTSGSVKSAMTGLNSAGRMTNAEILAYAQNHPELIQALEVANSTYKAVRLPIGALGTAWAVLAEIDADAAHDFFSRIRDMRTNGKGDPVATLIRRVSHERENGRRVELGLAMFLLFRAWNAYRDGETLLKFQIGSAERGYGAIPVPH